MKKREIKQLLKDNIIFTVPEMSINKKQLLSFNSPTRSRKFRFPLLLAYSFLTILLILPLSLLLLNNPLSKDVNKNEPLSPNPDNSVSIVELNIWSYFDKLKIGEDIKEETLYNYLQKVSKNLDYLMNNFQDFDIIFDLTNDDNIPVRDERVAYQDKEYIVTIDNNYKSLALKEGSTEMYLIIEGENRFLIITNEEEKVFIHQSTSSLVSLVAREDTYQYMEYSINYSALYITDNNKTSYLQYLYQESGEEYQISKEIITSLEINLAIESLLRIK